MWAHNMDHPETLASTLRELVCAANSRSGRRLLPSDDQQDGALDACALATPLKAVVNTTRPLVESFAICQGLSFHPLSVSCSPADVGGQPGVLTQGADPA